VSTSLERYIGTRSFAGEYAHPLEDVLTGYLPFLAGSFVMGAHFHLVFVWFLLRLTEVYEAHSGCVPAATLACAYETDLLLSAHAA
jgi:hypothetical protein